LPRLSGKLGDVRILAVQTAEVAAGRGDGIGQTARPKVIEGLLLDGIDAGSHQGSVYQSHQRSILVLPDAAQASVARADAAILVAERARNAAIKTFPELRDSCALFGHEDHRNQKVGLAVFVMD